MTIHVRKVLQADKWTRRRLRQRFLESYARDRWDNRKRSFKLAVARGIWDRMLGEGREQGEGRAVAR